MAEVKGKTRVGERRMMNCGKMAEIIAYKKANDITVRFDSGVVRDHMRYDNFKRGNIRVESQKPRDHLNKEYESITEMCRAWGIGLALYCSRKKRGWDVERSLTTPVKAVKLPVTDHHGVVYESKEEMLRAYGIDRATFHTREQKNWDLERIFTTPIKSVQTVKDHLGNVFQNKQAMIDYYGINISVFDFRRKKGWELKEALTTPVKDASAWREKYIGKRFPTNCGLYVRVTDITDVNHITVVFEDIGEERIVARKELDRSHIVPLGLSNKSRKTHTFCGFQIIWSGQVREGQTIPYYKVAPLDDPTKEMMLTAPMMVQIWKDRNVQRQEEQELEQE